MSLRFDDDARHEYLEAIRFYGGHFRGVPLAGAAHIAAIRPESRRLAMEGFLTKRICFASL